LVAAEARSLQRLFDPNATEFHTPCDMPEGISAHGKGTQQSIPGTAGEIARCAFESLSLKYRSVLESLETLTERRFNSIRVVGDGSLNHFLCQMIADARDRSLARGPGKGHLQDVSARRAAMAGSVEWVALTPQPNDAWEEADGGFKAIEPP
jgi:rhamnulokinase